MCIEQKNYEEKLPIFFREKDMRNMCVLKAKLRETMRNIRNGMLQKIFKIYFVFSSGQTSLHEILV